MDNITYYAQKYKCLNNSVDWVDRFGNWVAYNCICGGKTIPLFDVTHKIVTAQCRICHKHHKSNGETFHTCG